MKRLLTQLFLLITLVAFTTGARADDRWETLRAINWVENPTNHTHMGRFGELGPYQFRPATWRMHTRKPFSMATQREAADEVAVIHYEWIKAKLQEAGVAPTTFNIAMAWNTGVTNVITGHAPSVSFNYAERVVNLVRTFKQHTPAPTEPADEPVAIAAVAVAPVKISLVNPPMLSFSTVTDAPKFDIVIAPPAPEPVVFTQREEFAAAEKPTFVVTTTATLTPRFSLLPSLTD